MLQNESTTTYEAIEKCIRYCLEHGIRLFDNVQAKELYEDFIDGGDSSVPLNGIVGVWCDTFLVEDELVQFNIVETVKSDFTVEIHGTRVPKGADQ